MYEGATTMRPRLVKTSATLMISGALCWIAAEALELFQGMTKEVLILNFLAFSGMTIGVWSLHLGHATKAKKASLIGTMFISVAFLIFSVGTLALISAGDVNPGLAGDNPELAEQSWIFVGFFLLVLGAPLLGISTIQARVYPGGLGFMLVVVPLVSAITALAGVFSSLFTNLVNVAMAVCFLGMAGFVLSGRIDLNDPF